MKLDELEIELLALYEMGRFDGARYLGNNSMLPIERAVLRDTKIKMLRELMDLTVEEFKEKAIDSELRDAITKVMSKSRDLTPEENKGMRRYYEEKYKK